MKDILHDLYNGDYEPAPERDARDRELSERSYSFGAEVERAFGRDFMDDWWEIEGERSDHRAFQYYREGFRLGAKLMLAALT